MKRNPPIVTVHDSYVRTLPPSADGGLPSVSMFWFEANSMVVTVGVDQVDDQGPGGNHLQFPVASTFLPAGGPTGGPAWVSDQIGNILNASVLTTPCRNPQTFYAIYYTNAFAGHRDLIGTNNNNEVLMVSDIFTLSKPAIYDFAQRARVFGAPVGVWYAIRYRWNAAISGIKYNGNAEVTDLLGVPLMTSGFHWQYCPGSYPGSWQPPQNPTVLVCGFDEDTLVTGRDAEVRSYILDNYGLTI
jgi:hypothetical protein